MTTMTLVAAVLTLEMAASAAMGAHVDVHVRTPVEIAQLATKLGLAGSPTPLGFARWWDQGCEIYVPPLTRDTLAIWAHELRHCVEGHFHDQ